ncbi:MAG: mercury(II) reductase [Leptospira sp.]|nr:mercury(II) reductase [Leptospira sp.]
MKHIHSKSITQEEQPHLENQEYDLIIIGGGSAGFSASIQAGELNLKTIMINEGLNWGGTCVNVGCVPSKVLVRAGETVHNATYSKFPSIKNKGSEINSTQLFQEARDLVNQLQNQKYLEVIQDISNLTILDGRAKFVDPHRILVNDKLSVKGKNIFVATGSRTNIPNIEGIREIKYLTNETVFNLSEIPKSITFMGAGYISLELALAFRRLGSKVRILEYTDRVLRSQTKDITDELEKSLLSEGIELIPNRRVQKIITTPEGLLLDCKDSEGKKFQIIEEGELFVGTGRVGNTDSLGLESIGIEINKNGQIIVDEYLQTKQGDIYAIGDVNNTPSFVYTAAYEGKLAVNNAFGELNNIRSFDYTNLPWVVFTDPQVAGVGLDEDQAGKLGIDVDVSTIPVSYIPKSIVSNETIGFIKLIRNNADNTLAGARVIAKEGGEMIQLLSLFIKHKIPVQDIAQDLYPYLTFTEGIKLAALSFNKDIKKLSCCAS